MSCILICLLMCLRDVIRGAMAYVIFHILFYHGLNSRSWTYGFYSNKWTSFHQYVKRSYIGIGITSSGASVLDARGHMPPVHPLAGKGYNRENGGESQACSNAAVEFSFHHSDPENKRCSIFLWFYHHSICVTHRPNNERVDSDSLLNRLFQDTVGTCRTSAACGTFARELVKIPFSVHIAVSSLNCPV